MRGNQATLLRWSCCREAQPGSEPRDQERSGSCGTQSPTRRCWKLRLGRWRLLHRRLISWRWIAYRRLLNRLRIGLLNWLLLRRTWLRLTLALTHLISKLDAPLLVQDTKPPRCDHILIESLAGTEYLAV